MDGEPIARIGFDGTERPPCGGVERPGEAVVCALSDDLPGSFVFVGGEIGRVPASPRVVDVRTSRCTHLIRWLRSDGVVALWLDRGAASNWFEGASGPALDAGDAASFGTPARWRGWSP